jgi:hypothetical protein
LLTSGVPGPTALTDGFRLAFWVAVGIDLIALCAVLVVFRPEELRLDAETDESVAADEQIAA